MNNYYVYMYLREDGTPYYVGKGKANRAYRKGDREILPPNDRNKIKIVLQNLTEEQAFSNEIDFIAWYGRKDNNTGILRNLTDGGEGASGYKHSPEALKKISESIKKVYRGGASRGGWTSPGSFKLGHKPSEESIKKSAESRVGLKRSEETKRKIAEANKNRPPYSEETKRKISEKLKGRKHTIETRKKMSEDRKGKARGKYSKVNTINHNTILNFL